MLRLGIPVVGVEDMERAVRFWSAALGLEPEPDHAGGDWTTLVAAGGGDRVLGLQHSRSPVEPRPRVHLDLFVDGRAEQDEAVERLLRLGASRVDWDLYPRDPDFVVLADPDGNLFCVVDVAS